ncbi:MAG: DUF3365 domain-containing protein [Akkermansiaceae bacterium]|nr:DUF3365 domain-containing protein [Akkermansiaceae bacterium]
MKKCLHHILAISLLSGFTACQEKKQEQTHGDTATGATTESGREQELLTRGGEASAALLGSLGPKLKAALQARGPVHALTVCQQLAQPSTGEVSGKFEGLSISRVSLKARNPDNAADELDQEVLHTWEKQVASGAGVPADVIRYKDDKSAVFYRAIMTQDVCMKCHGDPATFSRELADRLAELYPGDMATGYATGQLRGAFRVEFEAAAE